MARIAGKLWREAGGDGDPPAIGRGDGWRPPQRPLHRRRARTTSANPGERPPTSPTRPSPTFSNGNAVSGRPGVRLPESSPRRLKSRLDGIRSRGPWVLATFARWAGCPRSRAARRSPRNRTERRAARSAPSMTRESRALPTSSMWSHIERSRAEPTPWPWRAGAVPSVKRYQCGSVGWRPSTLNISFRAPTVWALVRNAAVGMSWRSSRTRWRSAARWPPQRRSTDVVGHVHLAEGHVLTAQLGREERVQPQLTPSPTGEHEVGHRIVAEGLDQHLDNGRTVRLGRRTDEWVLPGFHVPAPDSDSADGCDDAR